MNFTRLSKLNRLAIGVIFTGLLLSGCESTPTKQTAYTTKEILIQRADELISTANQLGPPQQDKLKLEAAQIYFQQDLPDRARQAIANINVDTLTLQSLADYSLLAASLAWANDDFLMARNYLSNPQLESNIQQLPVPTRERWYRQRAELFDLLGEEQLSLNAYTALSALLTDPQQIIALNDQLWEVLSRLPQPTLIELLAAEQDKTRLGWLSLTEATRNSHGDVLQLQKNIDTWRSNWALHPAAIYPPFALQAIREIANSLPQRVALLLPLSGRLGASGRTARDGFLAAYYLVLNHGNATPAIRIYDTTSQADITNLYQQAVTDGAQLVVGPLQKKNVVALNQLASLPVPTIALNYLPKESLNSADNLFQFGLSASEEARQIAQQAWLEGHRRALAITPNSNLGERTLLAFTTEWLELGGELVAEANYEKNQIDFTSVVKPLLLIDQSLTRTKRLKKLFGVNLETGPERRRLDVDMLFIQATAKQARQIKPMLDFFYAADLPVFATSQIYSGHKNSSKDRDLDNIKFTAMPWNLPGVVASDIKPDAALHPSYQQLFALGLDAYQLHQGLLQMQLLPHSRFYGSTGTLRLDEGKILRKQPWAEFSSGKVRPAKNLSEL